MSFSVKAHAEPIAQDYDQLVTEISTDYLWVSLEQELSGQIERVKQGGEKARKTIDYSRLNLLAEQISEKYGSRLNHFKLDFSARFPKTVIARIDWSPYLGQPRAVVAWKEPEWAGLFQIPTEIGESLRLGKHIPFTEQALYWKKLLRGPCGEIF